MSATPSWTVTSDQEVTDLTPAGTPARGHRIGFQLSDGTFGSVFVPNSQYTTAAVKAAIIAQAATVAEIKGLTG